MDSKLRNLTRLAEQGDTTAAYALHQERVRLGLPLLPDEIIPEEDPTDIPRFLYYFSNGFGCVLDFIPAQYNLGPNTTIEIGRTFVWQGSWGSAQRGKRDIAFAPPHDSYNYVRFDSSQRLEDPVVQKHLLRIFLR